MVKRLIGTVSHYYPRIGVAVISLVSQITSGDMVSIEGPSTNVVQPADSLQIDGKRVESARAGAEVAMKVSGKVRPGDNVYLEAGERFKN